MEDVGDPFHLAPRPAGLCQADQNRGQRHSSVQNSGQRLTGPLEDGGLFLTVQSRDEVNLWWLTYQAVSLACVIDGRMNNKVMMIVYTMLTHKAKGKKNKKLYFLSR